MTNRVRVLHLVQNLNFGGMERIIAELAKRTDSSRFDTHVMALQYLGHFAEELDKYASVHLAPRMTKLSMLHPQSLSGAIRRIKPDIVHTHSGVWYKGGRAAKIANVPILIYTDHGRQNPDPLTYRAVDNIASRFTDTVVAVSDVLAEHMKTFVNSPKKVTVIANGVDTKRYTPRQRDTLLRTELGIAASTPIIGSIGRLESIKGYEVAVAAANHLLKQYPPENRPAIVLIGDGSQRANLERLVADAGDTKHIHFLGWRSNIESLLSEFDIFTMSSHSEGTSVSLLEAMSSGLCPIVTDVGGNAAVLGSSLSHRLVPKSDPAALAQAWADALSNVEQRHLDAQTARNRVIDHFSLDAMVRQYEALYQSSYNGLRSTSRLSSPNP